MIERIIEDEYDLLQFILHFLQMNGMEIKNIGKYGHALIGFKGDENIMFDIDVSQEWSRADWENSWNK